MCINPSCTYKCLTCLLCAHMRSYALINPSRAYYALINPSPSLGSCMTHSDSLACLSSCSLSLFCVGLHLGLPSLPRAFLLVLTRVWACLACLRLSDWYWPMSRLV